ncbi:uncharacterized protein LOC135511414 [Oncorhynchus masou masou]|uniref:uncharacterized protein LOC135511414 n=1 Tax=Oncorhynchus masou masou TaxID=90313 RepID=UPI003184656D
MRKMNQVSAPGHDNPAMEMKMTDGMVNQDWLFEYAMMQFYVPQFYVPQCDVPQCDVLQCDVPREFFESMYKGLVWDEDVIDGGDRSFNRNKSLLNHFRDLGSSNQDTDEVDLQYLNDVIVDGADPNPTDRFGQTVLLNVCSTGLFQLVVDLDVVECGADVLRPDSYGVTPLHIAASLDYVEMIHFPLERKGQRSNTNKDHQMPLHYAAKWGALRVLLQNEADISAQEYKKRTPLQLAANLDRTEAARTLMVPGSDAGVMDSDGHLCITAMIDKMTSVAHLVMNQFHVTERMTRQQFYSLHLLEPEPPCKQNPAREWPLPSIVHQRKLDLIMHPVVLKLITVKWKLYGRLGAWILLLLNFLFIVSWATVAISDKELYVFPESTNLVVEMNESLLPNFTIRDRQATMPSMTVPQLLYSLYRITLVDEHEFNSMVEVDSIVAHFLCGTFLALSSIVMVFLVYDNALANAVTQQAAVILQVEESMHRLCRFYDDHHIHRFYASAWGASQ